MMEYPPSLVEQAVREIAQEINGDAIAVHPRDVERSCIDALAGLTMVCRSRTPRRIAANMAVLLGDEPL